MQILFVLPVYQLLPFPIVEGFFHIFFGSLIFLGVIVDGNIFGLDISTILQTSIAYLVVASFVIGAIEKIMDS